MSANLAGKTSVVFGGSEGVGAAVVRLLAGTGANVVISSRGTAGRGHSLAANLDASSRGTVNFIPADMTDPESLESFAERLGAEYDGIDILVVSGGVSASDALGPFRFADMPLESLKTWTESQWWSRLMCLRACLPLLSHERPGVEGGRGKVVFVSTDAGRIATPFELAPGGAAAALILSTKVLARELAPRGIRVNTVSISVTLDTPGLTRALTGAGEKVFRRALERQPFPVTSEDVAEAVAFFASPASDAITGQTLSVNGGLSYPG